MKLQDPTAPYEDVIGRRRRASAATSAEYFRLGGRAPGERTRPSAGPVAVLGASDWALSEENVERTAAYLGALGGLLADFGFDVFAITAVPDLDAVPTFVGWVGGEETPSELAQLAAFDALGLSLSRGAAPDDSWSRIEPEGQPTSIEFIRTAFGEIQRLTVSTGRSSVSPIEAEASTASSTVRNETPRHGVVPNGRTDAERPSSEVLPGTGWDRTNRRSGGS